MALNSPLRSKINWTALVVVIVNIAAMDWAHLVPPKIALWITACLAALIGIFRTFATGTADDPGTAGLGKIGSLGGKQ
jgi:ABC-type transport system involved in cytochrome c biogenesis permease component